LIAAGPATADDGTVKVSEKYPLELTVCVPICLFVAAPWTKVIVTVLPGLK